MDWQMMPPTERTDDALRIGTLSAPTNQMDLESAFQVHRP